jgi:hypothetical protein
LTVSADKPLLLFNLDVSVEWDSGNDPIYLEQLAFDLKKASEHLFDFTDGQAALGHVNISQNADDWGYSHVVVHATNSLRPFAVQGGIVLTPTIDPDHEDIAYDIGQVHMGATWNRYGTPGQNLGIDWPLILAHELSHFLFFLDDTYMGLNSENLLIPVDTCTGSAMGDVYHPDNTEFVFDETHWASNCADTLTNRTLGRTEWQTVKLWYPWLSTPVADNTGPAILPFDVTSVDVWDPITPTNVLEDPTFYLDYALGTVNSSAARAFLLRDEYVIDQGSPVGGQNRLLARGAQPGDRLCVFDRPRAQFGCEIVQAGDERLAMEYDETWSPLIQLTPINTDTIHIKASGLPQALVIKARIFPEYGFGSPVVTLSGSNDIYSGTFQLDYSTVAGHVQLWVDEAASETNPRREDIVAYAIGGNPGAFRGAGGAFRGAGGAFRGAGGAFRGAGGAFRGAGAPLVSPDGQMIFFTENPAIFQVGELYTIQNMSGLPALPPNKTVVGQGYNLVASPSVTQIISGSISFQYLGINALVEGITEEEEEQLTIQFWNGNHWRALDTTLNTYYNLASARSQGSGIYALFGPAPVEPVYNHVFLPLTLLR